ncbi:ELM1/GtrOC1 family putative glycosyltransferase [Thermomonas brevis]
MSRALALHDGKAGNARQALALARALDADAGEHLLQPRAPWRWLAPRVPPMASRAFAALPAPPPALAIGCGRQAALATRLLRARGSRAVQILDPRIDPRHWDLVIAPRHDGLRGDNVLQTLGSLHPVDAAWLQHARDAFPALAALPAPHAVLLVGGPTRHAPLADADFAALLRQLAALARADAGSLSVVASRRTPAAWRAAITALDRDLPGLRWAGESDGANPYAGLLAHAGRIACTPDSVNMLSEAAAVGVPVFAWKPDAARGRLRWFVDALLDAGHARALDAAMAPYAAIPLRETARVAELVRARLSP